MQSTEKQVRYLMLLLGQKGYSVRYMQSSYKALGATMRERVGLVEDWVRSLGVARASALIEKLNS